MNESGPKSVPTYTVSMSFQPIVLLASGSVKPSATNSFLMTSNSRTTAASAPPRDRDSRQRSYFGYRQSMPASTQLSFSALPSASRSNTSSHFGAGLRYSASVVRRQIPRGCWSSRQKL